MLLVAIEIASLAEIFRAPRSKVSASKVPAPHLKPRAQHDVHQMNGKVCAKEKTFLSN
jgi:hypothetical protein